MTRMMSSSREEMVEQERQKGSCSSASQTGMSSSPRGTGRQEPLQSSLVAFRSEFVSGAPEQSATGRAQAVSLATAVTLSARQALVFLS
jgi:hypothetical protein